MSWFVVDDYLPSHRKLLALRAHCPDTFAAALGLWTLCGAWAAGDRDARHTGIVPAYVVDTFDGAHGRDYAGALVAAGLWEKLDDGWGFHDWADWNGPDAQRRRSDAARQRRMRLRRCLEGRHGKDCPPDLCPRKQGRVS